ncbi:hypothetical protein BH10PLA2_BH10PLA2_26590 [soil metagenome]
MTSKLPEDLEGFIRAEVEKGHFASEEAALIEAVQLLRNRVGPEAIKQPKNLVMPTIEADDPLLGVMRDASDEMDQIVAEAMRLRKHQAWRLATHE